MLNIRSRWTRSASKTSASRSRSAASSARRTRRENGRALIKHFRNHKQEKLFFIDSKTFTNDNHYRYSNQYIKFSKKRKWSNIFFLPYLLCLGKYFLSYTLPCRYLRNAATFKDVRSGEHGLELFKVSLSKKTYFTLPLLENQELMYFFQGDMKGHVDKYDWTYKGEDTYTLTIKNPTVDEEGTYSVSIAVDV